MWWLRFNLFCIIFSYLGCFGICLLDNSIEFIKRGLSPDSCAVRVLFLVLITHNLLGGRKEAGYAILETSNRIKNDIFLVELDVHLVFTILVILCVAIPD